MSLTVFAVAAHPDDIEMMMAGTLILLKQSGCDLHYMNIANGSCGSVTLGPKEIAAVRTEEAKCAASVIGAHFHEPLVDDIEILYEQWLVRKLCAVVREIKPNILLLQSPQDYMEDHQNSSRLMVTAAFCRGMRNYPTDPPSDAIDTEMAVYHALPYGIMDQLRKPIIPDFTVDISSVISKKRDMLACHKSQKEWLDRTQGMDNYLITMEQMSADVGKRYGGVRYAEGWRRHLHLGFGAEEFDPLFETLPEYIEHTIKGDRQ